MENFFVPKPNFVTTPHHFSLTIFSFFNTKAKLWVAGRKNLLKKIENLVEFDPKKPIEEEVIKQLEETQKILVNAKVEMINLKHPYIGTEHLVLAILKNNNELSKFYLVRFI